ncbi:expressed unknown protein [Seminavis robusta]|uniref:Protein kinase domain-containing protein n=1 Tax=Seminavis robusta TaxID=568900 RepID=A0A9N8DC65_9STRA|nr:expressed unknown protein [Seminavis robusta]|eukprot:Sro30_g019880.1 n/a (209) ;mRNA; r:145260-145985
MIAPSNPRRKETALTRPPETVASLLANADKILSDVDKSSLMRVREKRLYPTFDASEVDTGEVLGIGGFGVVSEVSDIRVDRSQPQSDGESDSQDSQGSKCAGIGHLPTVTIELHPEHHDHQDRHYEVATAKRQIASRVMRSGKARYAIKKLNPALSELDRTRGMIDMALEIKYLSVLWHPNIVKMRGVCTGDMLHPSPSSSWTVFLRP